MVYEKTECMNEKTNSRPEPDRYNLGKSAKDVFRAFGAESHGFSDFDAYIEALAPSTRKAFSDDGSPSYWISQFVENKVPTGLDAMSLMIWQYFYSIASNRLRGISASVDDVQKKVRDFDDKFNDIESKLDKLLQNQSDLTASLTKLESELTAKIDADTTAIEKHATAEASRVISQFP